MVCMARSALQARTSRLPPLYSALVAARFALTLAPQRGYIHPDEYFQNMEVIAGDIFSIDVDRTWEFNNTFPVRNIFIPKLTFGPPYYLIKALAPYARYHLGIDLRSPYFLLVVPRVFFVLLSLINDYCLYKICSLYGQNYKNRLTVFASSYVVLVFCCRSFSNSYEMIFFSVLLLLVAECMHKSDRIIYHEEFLRDKYQKASTVLERVKLYKLKTHLPAHSLSSVTSIATVAVVGVFNRPTFLGFAFPPLFFWLQRGLGSKVVTFKHFHYRIFTLILCAIPTVILLVLIDSGYYGYITLAEVESLRVSLKNFVVTPLNFVLYNIRSENLAAHGLHPRWLHFLVNLPLLFNVLGLMGLLGVTVEAYRFSQGHYSKLPKIQSITGLMLFSFITPVALLSLFPHQEARFIIPVIIPLVYLHGNFLFSNPDDSINIKKLKKLLLSSWYTFNIVLTIFFGFLHQGGVYPLVKKLNDEIKNNYGTHIHVVTSHSYSLPTSLLQLDSTTRLWFNKASGQKYKLVPQTFLYEFGSMPLDRLFEHLEITVSSAEKKFNSSGKAYRVYLAAPCALEVSVYETSLNYSQLHVVVEVSFYPHLSTEAMPVFPSMRDQLCLTGHLDRYQRFSHSTKLSITQRISCMLGRFCMKLYAVSLNHNSIS